MASGVKRQRSDGFDYDYEAVLLDIEGTTTPISFFKVTNLLNGKCRNTMDNIHGDTKKNGECLMNRRDQIAMLI